MQIKLLDTEAQRRRLGGDLEARLLAALAHGQHILGPEVSELELALARRTGRSYCVTCANGTDALVLALRVLGLKPGDGVLVPSFTFMATAEAVSLLGGIPIFVDVDARTFVMTRAELEHTYVHCQDTKIRGIIPVDLFGLCCNYDEIISFAREKGLFIISDAAQSFGASFKGAAAGSFGDIATTSFFPTKPLGAAGDGGALFTDNPDYATHLKSLRTHGQRHKKYEHHEIGYNSRLDTLQAAILLAKLTILDEELQRRNELAAGYTEALSEIVTTPVIPAGCQSAWAQYSICHPERDRIREELSARSIPSMIYYPTPLHHQPAYAHETKPPVRLANTEQLCKTILSIPLQPYLGPGDQKLIIDALHQILSEKRHG